MKKVGILLILLSFYSLQSYSEEDDNMVYSPYKAKSNSSKSETFTDGIKLIRIAEGEWDLFFDSKGGPYNIPSDSPTLGALQQAAKKAYDRHMKLTVTIDGERDQILGAVVSDETSTSSPANNSAGSPGVPTKAKENNGTFNEDKFLDDFLGTVKNNKPQGN